MARSMMIAALAALALSCGTANADSLFAFLSPPRPAQLQPQVIDPMPEEQSEPARIAPRLKKQIVPYAGRESPGTIIVDTANTFLYYLLGGGKAIRYGIGVGREGFTWAGVKAIARKAEWPDWYPPPQMISRQPYLPRMVAGGPGNPLGARALYIGGTEYRIHGTNDPSSIGKHVSSGCIRLTNEDVTDLYNRVQIGAKVIVLPQTSIARSGPRERSLSVRDSFMPQLLSPAQTTWDHIRRTGVY
ncbi:MAG TPA: L,D-transpeptidase [Pseudolabrys sp.]|nr:L,D-transpeptidase [Pseudolabrys sp.]